MKNLVVFVCLVFLNVWAVRLRAQLSITLNAPAYVCVGQDNGVATVTATGGSGYTYHWSNNGSTGPVDSTVQAGNIAVTVTDNASQTASASAAVGQDFFDFALMVFQPSCSDTICSAKVAITIGGGTINYMWSNGDSTDSVSHLAPGSYSITVTDSNGCSLSTSFTAHADTLLNANVSATGSTGNNGTASVTIVQGNPPYLYSWSNGDTTATITSLQPGTYQVTVADWKGCSDTLSVTVPYVMGIASQSGSPGFSVYPNPACGYVTIDAPGPATIELWDVAGNKISSRQTFAAGKLQLDLRNYPPGNYLVYIKGSSYTRIVPLVIVR